MASPLQYQNPNSPTATLETITAPDGNLIEVVAVNNTSRTPASPGQQTVGVSSGEILASNLNRQGLVLTNVSSNWISIGLGVSAVLNYGISLAPNGGVWEMDIFSFYNGAIYAIASGASSPLAIQEFST